jgi:molybdopterin/thiamine biosynthesis adenylyltransferase
MLGRHDGLLSPEDLSRLGEAVICGGGTGGVGGWIYTSLARLGCRTFKLADPGRFDATNANRQAGCNSRTVGRHKVDVLAEEITAIHPGARVETCAEGITVDSVHDFLEGGSVVVDGIDLYSLEAKKGLYDASRDWGLPVFSCPVLAFGAALAIFHPTRSPSFERYFGPIPDRSDENAYRAYLKQIGMGFFGFKPRFNWPGFADRVYRGIVPSVGTACLLSGALATTAIVDYLIGRDSFPVVPRTLHVDLMERRLVVVGKLRRWILRNVVGRYLRAQESRARRRNGAAD